MRPRLIDEEKVLTLVALGKPSREIAKVVGCHYTSIPIIARRHGIAVDKIVERRSFDAAIRRIMERGERRTKVIAQEAGCSERTVAYAVAKMKKAAK